MRLPTWLLFLFLAVSPLWSKPKVDLRVKVNAGIGRNRPQDAFSTNKSVFGGPTVSDTVYFLNVIVLSDNAEAVAKNNGQWCITGDGELGAATVYHGTLEGNTLELEIPRKNGKTKKEKFDILDHKWRDLSDL